MSWGGHSKLDRGNTNKATQTERNLEIKIRSQTGTSVQVSPTEHKMITDIANTTTKTYTLVKDNVNSKQMLSLNIQEMWK